MASLPDLFREHLAKNLEQSGTETRIIDRILKEYQEIGFCKTANRSVLGSMNDYIKLFGFRLEYEDEPAEREIMILNMKSNATPMGALKYRYPIEVLKELVEEKYK